MDGPLFLTLDEVLQLHSYQIQEYGGDPAILNIELLESAQKIAMPRQTSGGDYLHDDLAAMAAAYLFHIVKDHPFADGNKRTGMHAAIVFLELNGSEIELDPDETERLVLGVVAGIVTKDVGAISYASMPALLICLVTRPAVRQLVNEL